MTERPQDSLPDPLVPAEVDLRGLEYMPLLGGKLFGSDFDLDANDAEFRVGLRLWWAAWNQVPAASLPPEDHRQRGLAGLAENPTKWRKVREKALQGFIPCNDGRLYHPIVAQQALIAWEKRAEHIEEKENAADRQRRSRAERKAMFADLRARGVAAKFDIPMDDLRALHRQHVTPNVTPPVTVTSAPPVTEPVTVTATAKTGRDGTGQEIQDNTEDFNGRSGRGPGGAELPETKAGAVGLAFKRAGVDPMTLNLGDPRLAELLRQGATPEEFEGLAREAIRQGVDSPYPWVLSVLPKRRAAAATIALAPPPADPEAWRKGGERSIRAMAEQLGLRDVGEDEQWPAFEHRVLQAWRRKGSPAPQPRRTTA